MPLVIKQWYASETPGEDGAHVRIDGRSQGALAFILSILGIAPVTNIRADKANFRFEQGSLKGSLSLCIPLGRISSVLYGFSRPWKEALSILASFGAGGTAAILASMNRGYGQPPPVMALVFWWIVSLAVAFVYYKLNKTMTLGIAETGGSKHYIEFKRSVIENVALDEKQAKYAGDLIIWLMGRRSDGKA